jgi:hypothetical protein
MDKNSPRASVEVMTTGSWLLFAPSDPIFAVPSAGFALTHIANFLFSFLTKHSSNTPITFRE